MNTIYVAHVILGLTFLFLGLMVFSVLKTQIRTYFIWRARIEEAKKKIK
jgi:hypothetical protein